MSDPRPTTLPTEPSRPFDAFPAVREQDRQCQQPGVQWQRQGTQWQRQGFDVPPIADDQTTIVRIAPHAVAVPAEADGDAPPWHEPRGPRTAPGRDSNLF